MIDHKDSFTYNLVHDLEVLGASLEVLSIDDLSIERLCLSDYQGLLLSPGPGHPKEAIKSLELLSVAVGEIPILGICLGHQLIASHFGARVIRGPIPMHGKVSMVHHSGRGIFKGLLDPTPVTRYHSLVVEEKSLPRELEVTARTADGLIMGLMVKDLGLHGVQYHPEALLTAEGSHLLANFLKEVRDAR